LRRYETIFISYHDLPEDEITALIERYCGIIKDRKGTVIKAEKWGKRKLAYEIKKQSRGFYVLIDFAGSTDVVTELERNLKIGDKIVKFMTVKTRDSITAEEIEKEMAPPPPPVVEEKAEAAPPADQEKPLPQENIEPAKEEIVATPASETPSPAPANKEEE